MNEYHFVCVKKNIYFYLLLLVVENLKNGALNDQELSLRNLSQIFTTLLWNAKYRS
jgi:hypothetical protein